MATDKEILRREALRHRDLIVPEADDAEKAAALFFDAIAPAPGQSVALYWPKGREFDTSALLERLLAEGFTCALPVMQPGSLVMKFAVWKEGQELIAGPFGVMQPANNEKTHWIEPDLVIVPLLAFDRRGNRLGYGGGHYDATLGHLRQKKDIIAIGLAYALQAVLYKLPIEAHDQKLNNVITPAQVHTF